MPTKDSLGNEDMTLDEIRARMAENTLMLAEAQAGLAANRAALADAYAEIADNVDDPENAAILKEFVKTHGGDEKRAKKEMATYFRRRARDARQGKGGEEKAPAPAPETEKDPFVRRLLGAKS